MSSEILRDTHFPWRMPLEGVRPIALSRLAGEGEAYIQLWLYELELSAPNYERSALLRIAGVYSTIRHFHTTLAGELVFYRHTRSAPKNLAVHAARLDRFTDAFLGHCLNLMIRVCSREKLGLQYRLLTARRHDVERGEDENRK